MLQRCFIFYTKLKKQEYKILYFYCYFTQYGTVLVNHLSQPLISFSEKMRETFGLLQYYHLFLFQKYKV